MRYIGVDLTRSVAIFGVMIAHALTASNLSGVDPSQDTVLLQAVRTLIAPTVPVFIILFGAMLQLVYARKYAAGQEREITHRLLTRAFQCWLLYVLSAAVLSLSAGYSLAYFVRSALLMGDMPFTDILKFYTLMLLISPMLVHFSTRNGLRPLILFCLVIQVAYPIVSQISPPGTFPGASSMAATLYGGVNMDHAGPSALHGITFVVFGMAVGKTLQAQGREESLLFGPQAWVRYGFVALLAASLLLMWVCGFNYLDAADRTEIRTANHPVFYLFGMASTLIYLEVFVWIAKLARITAKSVSLVFSRTSIFTFCFGNSWLYLVMLHDPSAAPSYALFWSSVVVMFLLSYVYIQVRESRFIRSDHLLARTYRWIVTDSADQLVDSALRIADRVTAKTTSDQNVSMG